MRSKAALLRRPCCCHTLSNPLVSSSSIDQRRPISSKSQNSSPSPPALGEAGSSTWYTQRRSFRSSAPARAAKKDPYTALGVSKSADKNEVKKAYYQLAKKYHPDTNKDAAAKERFVEIQDAFDTIGDEEKRQAYDKFGAAAQDPNFDAKAYERASSAFGGGAGFGPADFGAGNFNDFFANRGGAAGAGGANASDIFETLFGSFGGARPGSARSGRFQGEDIEVQLSINFEEACKGTNRTIPISPVVQHAECKGTGLKPGAKRQPCRACGGSGTSTFTVQGNFHMQTTCSTCRGQGSTIPPGGICTGCQGVGVVKERTFVPIEIPAGVEDGMRVRIDGRGDAPFEGNGTPGDLYVRVAVGASKIFRRQGANLFHDKTVPFHTAALGGTVTVPTLDEPVSVRVPAGTQQGEEMVLRGRGVPRVNSRAKGDLTCKFTVSVPRSLTPLQKSLLEQYRDSVEGKTTTKKPEQPKAAPIMDEPQAPPPKPESKESSIDESPRHDETILSSAWKGVKSVFGSR